MGRSRSPGPVYMLPTTIGFNKHDVSRYRNPMYTMRPNVNPPLGKSIAPGPQYQIRGLCEHGKFSPPAYSIKSRPKPLTAFLTPGPGAHSPEKVPRMKEQRPPAYTMQPRPITGYNSLGPGPAYNLPSMLGPKVPNKPAAGAYTMVGRQDLKPKERSPGPANYRGINTNLYRNKLPIFTMASRLQINGPFPAGRDVVSPGPAAYLPKKLCGEKGLMYSMRSRGPDIFNPYITAEDNMPCFNRYE